MNCMAYAGEAAVYVLSFGFGRGMKRKQECKQECKQPEYLMRTGMVRFD